MNCIIIKGNNCSLVVLMTSNSNVKILRMTSNTSKTTVDWDADLQKAKKCCCTEGSQDNHSKQASFWNWKQVWNRKPSRAQNNGSSLGQGCDQEHNGLCGLAPASLCQDGRRSKKVNGHWGKRSSSSLQRPMKGLIEFVESNSTRNTVKQDSKVHWNQTVEALQ